MGENFICHSPHKLLPESNCNLCCVLWAYVLSTNQQGIGDHSWSTRFSFLETPLDHFLGIWWTIPKCSMCLRAKQYKKFIMRITAILKSMCGWGLHYWVWSLHIINSLNFIFSIKVTTIPYQNLYCDGSNKAFKIFWRIYKCRKGIL